MLTYMHKLLGVLSVALTLLEIQYICRVAKTCIISSVAISVVDHIFMRIT